MCRGWAAISVLTGLITSPIAANMGGLNLALNAPSSIVSRDQSAKYGLFYPLLNVGADIGTLAEIYWFQPIWDNVEIGFSSNSRDRFKLHVQALVTSVTGGGQGHYYSVGMANVGQFASTLNPSIAIGSFINYTYQSKITNTRYNVGVMKDINSGDAKISFSMEQDVTFGTFFWGWDGLADTFGLDVPVFGIPMFFGLKILDSHAQTSYQGIVGIEYDGNNPISQFLGGLFGSPSPYKPTLPGVPAYSGPDERVDAYTELAMKQGYEFYCQGNLDGALDSYLKALSQSPKTSLACERIGTIYYQKNQPREALNYWRKALNLNPSNAVLAAHIISIEQEVDTNTVH